EHVERVGQRLDTVVVGVDHGDVVLLGEALGDRRADLSRADDDHLHRLRLLLMTGPVAVRISGFPFDSLSLADEGRGNEVTEGFGGGGAASGGGATSGGGAMRSAGAENQWLYREGAERVSGLF